MRKYLTFTTALCSIAGAAFAADVDAESRITDAVVYPQGALVTRTAQFTMPAGDNRIIIDDLPLNFDAHTLRVKGVADAELTIVSVDHRITRLPPTPDDDNPERLRIEAEIEAIEERLRLNAHSVRELNTEIGVADARLNFVNVLMKREPQKMVDDVEYQRASAKEWSAMIQVLAAETGTALAAKVEAERQHGDLRRAAAELREEIVQKQEELAAIDLPAPDRSVATVEVASASDLTGALELSYRVWEAGWQPVYDLRLDQGETATLEIERHARIWQTTNEDWEGVALSLSTARPSERMDTPDLGPLAASLVEVVEYERRGIALDSSSKLDDSGSSVSEKQAELLDSLNADSEPEMEEVIVGGVAAVGIETQGQTVVYSLANTADVSGDGTVRQLTIDSDRFDVGLLARAVPELDTTAYLYAALANEFSGPILPGAASVYRDDTYSGDIRMPFVAASDKVTLPFGALDGVTISRHVLEREDGDFGIIGTTNRRVLRLELSASSVLGYAIPLTVFDRAPVSEEEDLTIKVTSRPAPTETDIDGKRGLHSWTFELAPGTERKILFGYDINWPGNKEILVNPYRDR